MIEELGIILIILGELILKRAGADHKIMVLFLVLSLLIQLFLMLEFKNETPEIKEEGKG
jgi:hypothetical protein